MPQAYKTGDVVLYEEGDSNGRGTWKVEVLGEDRGNYLVEVLEKVNQTGLHGVILEPGNRFYAPKSSSKMDGGLVGKVVGLHRSSKEAA